MNSKNPFCPYNEEVLIKLASKGDMEAFNQLVLRHQDVLYHHACSLLNDPDLAEDITQSSLIKAFQGLSKYRGGSFRAWLLRIVTNSAYDRMRWVQRHPTQPLFLEDEDDEESDATPWLADPAPSVQARVEQNELSSEIDKLIAELPEVYRTVITLIDFHELDYAEAAEALGVPMGTVKSRVARARFHMKEKLQASFLATR